MLGKSLLRLAGRAAEGIQFVGERIVLGDSTRLPGKLLGVHRNRLPKGGQKTAGSEEPLATEQSPAHAEGAG